MVFVSSKNHVTFTVQTEEAELHLNLCDMISAADSVSGFFGLLLVS